MISSGEINGTPFMPAHLHIRKKRTGFSSCRNWLEGYYILIQAFENNRDAVKIVLAGIDEHPEDYTFTLIY
jgi:hypothetical protein